MQTTGFYWSYTLLLKLSVDGKWSIQRSKGESPALLRISTLQLFCRSLLMVNVLPGTQWWQVGQGLEAAVKSVRGGMGLREASQLYDVPVETLRRRVIGVAVDQVHLLCSLRKKR